MPIWEVCRPEASTGGLERLSAGFCHELLNESFSDASWLLLTDAVVDPAATLGEFELPATGFLGVVIGDSNPLESSGIELSESTTDAS